MALPLTLGYDPAEVVKSEAYNITRYDRLTKNQYTDEVGIRQQQEILRGSLHTEKSDKKLRMT